MKHFVLTALLLGVIAAAAGMVSFRLSGNPEVKVALSQGDALEWMRVEFDLTDAQLARIKTLRDSYGVECEQHCRAIQLAARTKKKLQTNGAPPEQIAAAEKEFQELRAFCEQAIAGHVRRCAAEMNPDAGQRYLSLVLPKISNFDHQAAPGPHLGHPAH